MKFLVHECSTLTMERERDRVVFLELDNKRGVFLALQPQKTNQPTSSKPSDCLFIHSFRGYVVMLAAPRSRRHTDILFGSWECQHK